MLVRAVSLALSLTLLNPALISAIVELEPELVRLRNVVGSLARQTLLQQYEAEERVRTEGDSGINLVRRAYEGTRSYHHDHHTSHSFMSIHDHANNRDTMGMGEVEVVMNGVQFRTRHNDYALEMKLHTREFGARKSVYYPNVPSRVTNQKTVEGQIAEMRQWFKAWRDQDYSTRDYRIYFKPVLCYLEGMWTYADGDTLDEPFPSDRHFLDAAGWFDLEEKMRYLAYSGDKDYLENLGNLPRIIINVTADGEPVFAKWNYDILCHQIEDVPLNRLRVVDDLASRMRHRQSLTQFANTRMARFQLNSHDEKWGDERSGRMEFIDELMYQVPGRDGYGDWKLLEDYGLGRQRYMYVENSSVPLNANMYHKVYVTELKDAMGSQRRFRGFNDKNLYVAKTVQPKVAGIQIKTCEGGLCRPREEKFTYAIPLEIIWLTPLTMWNPYNITYRGEDTTSAEKRVTAGGRNGSPEKPFDGTNRFNFYQTPVGFFDDEYNPEAADTTPPGAVHVLDADGVPRVMKASGHRVILPNIPGIGLLRQRYPIAPVHAEGSSVWKELDALKEIVMNQAAYQHMLYSPFQVQTPPFDLSMTFKLQEGIQSHVHLVELNAQQIGVIQAEGHITVMTSLTNGHQHTLVLSASDGLLSRLQYSTCDGLTACGDGHPPQLAETNV